MLLFQLGTYSFTSEPPRFRINITRQLMWPGDSLLDRIFPGDDLEIWHLKLTFFFTEKFDELGMSNNWCHSPSQLTGFENMLSASPVLPAVRGIAPSSVELDFENAE